MPRARVGSGTIYYETHGEPSNVPLVMINGVGHQLVYWDAQLIYALVGAGLFVVVFDNRDTGLSSKHDHRGKARLRDILEAIEHRRPFETPYGLDAMAGDTVGLLDHLGIAAAHVLGMSMGGMIAQEMAILHPDRMRSMISVMSTTGDPRIGRATAEAHRVLFTPPSRERGVAISARIEADRIIGTPGHHDEEASRRHAERSFDRCHHPPGTGRQLAATYRSGNRTKQLAGISVPTLVIHGTEDPLIDLSGGRATAACIPGAELVEIRGMGHDIPPAFREEFVTAVVGFIDRVEAG